MADEIHSQLYSIHVQDDAALGAVSS